MWTSKTARRTGKAEAGNGATLIVGGLRTGTPVKVRQGPFCGALGSIVERKPHRLALVQIEVMGRSVCVEVDPRHIDVLN